MLHVQRHFAAYVIKIKEWTFKEGGYTVLPEWAQSNDMSPYKQRTFVWPEAEEICSTVGVGEFPHETESTRCF